MKEIKIVGIGKMLDMPPGTMYIPIDTTYDVDGFLASGPLELNKLLKYIKIYGNNNVIGTIDSDPENQHGELNLCYSDTSLISENIVNYAGYMNTVCIILTEDDLPACFSYYLCNLSQPNQQLDNLSYIKRKFDPEALGKNKDKPYAYYRQVTKEEFLKLREKFLEDNFPDAAGIIYFANILAHKYLNEDNHCQTIEGKYYLNLGTKMRVKG